MSWICNVSVFCISAVKDACSCSEAKMVFICVFSLSSVSVSWLSVIVFLDLSASIEAESFCRRCLSVCDNSILSDFTLSIIDSTRFAICILHSAI